MKKVDIYIEASSRFLGSQPRWAGYVNAYELKNGKLFTKEGFFKTEGTYNRAVVEAAAKAIGRVREPCEIHIYTENAYVLDMVDRNLESWAANGFVNAKGKAVKEKEAWEALWKAAKEHLLVPEPGEHEFSKWMAAEMRKKEGVDNNGDNSVDNSQNPHEY